MFHTMKINVLLDINILIVREKIIAYSAHTSRTHAYYKRRTTIGFTKPKFMKKEKKQGVGEEKT